ncbi:MAG: HAD family hydrolase [Chloroflexi bacterium]|nr:HAD family hydrolase [Chloroflexota bacterium]MDA1002379.1 HAD family hydrolase [Chloroflexota bacterium]
MSVGTPPRAVIFDLDGTLVDSLESVAAAMARALSERGFAIETATVVPLVGPPMELLVEQVTGWPPEVSRAVNEDYARLYYGEYIEHSIAMPGAGALLDRLTAHGIPLTVLTNKVESGGRRMLEVLGWTERFALVAGRDTLAEAKPAPDGALYLLEQLGVPPSAGAIVGDTEFDICCGRDAGLAYVIGMIGERSEAQLRAAGATHVAHSLDAVGGILLGDRRD